jgi:BlaI family penicillinase repressor
VTADDNDLGRITEVVVISGTGRALSPDWGIGEDVMSRQHHLGELQLAIMRVLWEHGEATVASVHRDLEEQRALTTIATMLSKMEKKGIVVHREEGRQFVYRTTVSEAEVQKTMVASLTEKLFEGDVTALVSHLLTSQEIDVTKLERLQGMIEQRRRLED